jgi:SAM-dependent methyltransferase
VTEPELGYTGRLLAGGSFLTRQSHRSRMDRALRMLDGRKFTTAADVGAADAWYLRAMLERGMVEEAVAIDTDSDALQLAASAGDSPSLTFARPDDPALTCRYGTFDFVSCLETLEHVDDVSGVLDEVVELGKPGGTVLISVPVEVGPSLLVKQAGRWLANRRGGYGYERYSWHELWRAGIRWNVEGMQRQNLYSHKAFDFRAVRKLLDARISVTRTAFSPVPMLGPVLASTVYWLGTKRSVTHASPAERSVPIALG